MPKIYAYVGEGNFLLGLPTKNIPADDWEKYPEQLTETALKLGLYELQSEDEPAEAEEFDEQDLEV